jgi:hypothetical protein
VYVDPKSSAQSAAVSAGVSDAVAEGTAASIAATANESATSFTLGLPSPQGVLANASGVCSRGC